MPFRYLTDPLFLCCFTAYWLHRGLAVLDLSTPFLRGYLNDVICVPFWLPMMLWLLKMLGLRRNDGPPNAIEVVIPVLIWSLLFEVVLPNQDFWPVPTVGDPYDILAYWLGAMLSVLFWNWYYAGRRGLEPVQQGNG